MESKAVFFFRGSDEPERWEGDTMWYTLIPVILLDKKRLWFTTIIDADLYLVLREV